MRFECWLGQRINCLGFKEHGANERFSRNNSLFMRLHVTDSAMLCVRTVERRRSTVLSLCLSFNK